MKGIGVSVHGKGKGRLMFEVCQVLGGAEKTRFGDGEVVRR